MSMNLYHSNNIGNVAVLGHLGSGKTSVIEAMAKRAGISQQIGTISQGTTISDYDVEEIKRQSSINLSLIPLESIEFNLALSWLTLWESSDKIFRPSKADFIANRMFASILLIIPFHSKRWSK